ncbi:RNA polymerase II-associated protein 1 homolog [Taphrina deformans PYCC 5710]|uniref:RNA polymerase II-associated protein 1 homolog n=1 Tax=Taphrina deformans (strain PYCC 5710 / ATCC 11124 / CBS 356.35 / IMI 108563 / JCM 9778 / NBRC 8474) TaxID=1097556 RepID=R4XBH1_TAPDE|nr:RNA polymerase II-associated protein 1 homolog [Taphrina deformans PYCC 5710]|eukprot:CCG83123.1 RNA polymerase II-associated protein 1 homolog [Taphrina deformans PYCC 5710]
MSEQPRKPVRQDYILRVRYSNTLPPPPFEPKLLKLPMSLSQYTSVSYLSTLIQEQPMKLELDKELGMPLDLSLLPGLFEGDESVLFAPSEPVELDPKDKALLKGPSDTYSGKPMADSAFLRRTQYISSEITQTNKAKQQEAERAKKIKAALKIELDPVEQLAAVEKTFETVAQPLSELKHPAKRGLKAVEAWNVLPNFECYEHQYVNAKFPSNPAPRTKSNTVAEDEDPRLEVSCMVPRIVDDTIDAPDNDYISYFITDHETALSLKRKNMDGDGAGHQSRYKFVREYDAKKDDGAAEWAITFAGDTAHYLELGSRMNMRGRRRGTQVTQTNEVIEMTLRAPEAEDEKAEQGDALADFGKDLADKVIEESHAELDSPKPLDDADDREDYPGVVSYNPS